MRVHSAGNVLLTTALLLKSIKVAMVTGDEYEYRLISDLLHNYDPRIRPSHNASHPLNVTFGLALSQIIDVDEKNQIITTNCWLNQVWIDYKLTWDPDKYGGVRVLRLPYDAIWKPDILLYNNADVSSYKSSISTNVIVTSDGNVTWLSMVIFRSSCTIDVKYFPFDEQNCSMQFASWTYDGFQVNLIKVGEDGDLSNYIPNTEWALMRLHAIRNVVFYSCCAEPYPDVTYTIQMRRKPLFYVFNMILPCFLITLVALLGFYIPSDSGEKVSMGITTLLSMTVFLMLVAENMPPTSDVLPLVGLYYGITIAIVSLATAMTVLTLNIHHIGHEGRPVPPFVKFVCFSVLARFLFLRLQLPNADIEQTSMNSDGNRVYIRMNRSKQTTNDENIEASSTKGQGRKSVLDFIASRGDGGPCEGLDEAVQLDEVVMATGRRPENGGLTSSSSSGVTYTCRGNTTSSPHPPHQPHIRLDTTSGFSSLGSNGSLGKQISRTLSKVCQTIARNEARLAGDDQRAANRVEWQQVALVVDRVLLFVFTVGTIAITLGVLLHAPLSRDFLFGSSVPAIEGRNVTAE